MSDPRRLEIAPCPTTAVRALEADLDIGPVTAQALVRRGLDTPAAARAWLAADERHDPSEFEGMEAAVALVRRHVDAGSPITVHGDYDVDGVCSTAVLVRALRSIGAAGTDGEAGGRIDWYLPSRLEDGYGLNARTVDRLAAAGTRLLITADCAITAVDEVAAARAAGMDVLVTDHHAPRADGVLPDALIVHPAVCGYPFTQLCATAVAAKLAEALGAPTAAEDLDLVALATVADVVALRGENRRLVREGLRALATTSKPGLRALMRVAQCDPTRLDARAVAFRLAPRINAAGRLRRADAGLELVLTTDEARAGAVAEELDQANAERRHVEQRMLFEAEAQANEQAQEAAIVVAAEGWHAGVAGIVASRLAERHHRPVVVIALGAGRGTGSGRSIPAFDLLGGLHACAEHLARHGGHRAAAGLEIEAGRVDAFRAAFAAHAAEVLTADDFVAVERVDAIAAGGDLGRELAEELALLEPFGHENPPVTLLVPAATLADPRPMGEGKHVRFTLRAGGVRAKAVAFGCGGRLPVSDGPADATFTLELNEWKGVVEPRLVLRHAQPCEPGTIEVLGAAPDYMTTVLAELDSGALGRAWLRPRSLACGSHATLPASLPDGPSAPLDRRDRGVAGTIAALVASGEPVLVVCADAVLRHRGLHDRLGGFALCDWPALARQPSLAAPYAHVVAVDPPPDPALLVHVTVRAWGTPELDFVARIHERERDLRADLTALYRDLRAAGDAGGEQLETLLRGAHCRRPEQAGRLLRILTELGLVELDLEPPALRVPAARRTALERSAAFRAYTAQADEAYRWLSEPPPAQAA